MGLVRFENPDTHTTLAQICLVPHRVLPPVDRVPVVRPPAVRVHPPVLRVVVVRVPRHQRITSHRLIRLNMVRFLRTMGVRRMLVIRRGVIRRIRVRCVTTGRMKSLRLRGPAMIRWRVAVRRRIGPNFRRPRTRRRECRRRWRSWSTSVVNPAGCGTAMARNLWW